MKKLFSIVLAVAMVLSVASVAFAGAWDKAAPASDAFGYKIEVVKFTRSTGALGSSTYNVDPNATAVNGADVYFAIKLTVPDLKATDNVRINAKATVSFTAIGGAATPVADLDISALAAGVYYYDNATQTFDTISNLSPVSPVYNFTCQDTETAKVSAKVVSERPLAGPFTVGDYTVSTTATTVIFADSTAANTVTFTRDSSNGKVSAVAVAGTDAQFVAKLYTYLGITAADISDGKVYMSDDNLRAFAGFAYKTTSEATWKANSTPIILDPTISIPKTGDNASVIGFAMIMVAIVAAAVAVKKVNA
ncbi:MAG: hypothetical protein EOM66_01165 [Clostridia bacterium]|nr:hypothetical protein [Candidatus Pelethousia sp.]NCB30002.1 hypothetical protein [Clostridia bacterium]